MSQLPFHSIINAWFNETYGKPTPVQEEAWPLIAKGEHVLAIAPTGSGKTLTGFLSAISRFAEGVYNADELSVLYVSPLKALNEDIRRNLLLPLEGIKARFEKEAAVFPAIRVETRSGDTTQTERRRFLARPPSILALTPESLGIILLNPKGRQVLSTVRYVILDEIHAALGSKRGCYLSCQIDRLALAAGEFQRIALSATIKPPEAAADFAGGLRRIAASGVSYEKRKVHIVAPNDKKEIELKVVFPEGNRASLKLRLRPRRRVPAGFPGTLLFPIQVYPERRALPASA
jgi:ATP-dependent Lhr-like helicase